MDRSNDATSDRLAASFAGAAAPPIAVAIMDFAATFGERAQTIPDADVQSAVDAIDNAKAALAQAELLVKTEATKRNLSRIDRIIETLDDSEAPQIGRRFLTAVGACGVQCEVATSGLSAPAVYLAYSLAPEDPALLNIQRIDCERAAKPLEFYVSSIHERLHALQRESAVALQCSPYNRETSVVPHPEDWVLLQLLAERDAFAKTALFTSLLAPHIPGLAESTKGSAFGPNAFNDIRNGARSLNDAMVGASLESLSGRVDPAFARSYEDSYCDAIIASTANALKWRRFYGLPTNYVRLETKDFHAVGKYGVGPNTLGEFFMEPMLLRRPSHSPEQAMRLNAIIEDFDVPRYGDCPTLTSFLEPRKQSLASPPSFDRTLPALAVA